MSRRSLRLSLLTLTAIEESFGAATYAGLKGRYTRYSRHRPAARRIRHFYDCFPAARTRGLDPEESLTAAIGLPKGRRPTDSRN